MRVDILEVTYVQIFVSVTASIEFSGNYFLYEVLLVIAIFVAQSLHELRLALLPNTFLFYNN